MMPLNLSDSDNNQQNQEKDIPYYEIKQAKTSKEVLAFMQKEVYPELTVALREVKTNFKQ